MDQISRDSARGARQRARLSGIARGSLHSTLETSTMTGHLGESSSTVCLWWIACGRIKVLLRRSWGPYAEPRRDGIRMQVHQAALRVMCLKGHVYAMGDHSGFPSMPPREASSGGYPRNDCDRIRERCSERELGARESALTDERTSGAEDEPARRSEGHEERILCRQAGRPNPWRVHAWENPRLRGAASSSLARPPTASSSAPSQIRELSPAKGARGL